MNDGDALIWIVLLAVLVACYWLLRKIGYSSRRALGTFAISIGIAGCLVAILTFVGGL